MRLWLLKPREINVLPHIFHSQEMEKRGDNKALITVELIVCVICNLAEEIEKATGKEEQFKVVKGQVIENNLSSFQPISFHRKGNCVLQHNLASFHKIYKYACCRLNCNATIPLISVAAEVWCPYDRCICVLGRQIESVCCLCE